MANPVQLNYTLKQASDLPFSFNTNKRANLLIAVCVYSYLYASVILNSMTFNGKAMTQGATSGSSTRFAKVFYLWGPAQGSYTVNASWSGSATSILMVSFEQALSIGTMRANYTTGNPSHYHYNLTAGDRVYYNAWNAASGVLDDSSTPSPSQTYYSGSFRECRRLTVTGTQARCYCTDTGGGVDMASISVRGMVSKPGGIIL